MAHIRRTSRAVLNGVQVKGFPVIIDSNLKIHRLSLQYFLSIRATCSESTLFTYAQHLSDFITQLEIENEDLAEADRLQWDEIDDDWLESYSVALRERMGTDEDNTNNYVSQLLRTTISYLNFAQKRGYTSNLLGYDENVRIRLTQSKRKGTVSHPLVKRLSKEKAPARTAPRQSWIEAIKSHTTLKSPEHYHRFELMVDWCVAAGLRGHEACALEVDQLPLRETAARAIVNEQNVYVDLVVTKGSKPKRIPVSPVLVKKTWDYIEQDRKAVLSKFKKMARKKKTPYVESEAIFVSAQTGNSLHPRAFSNQVRQAFLNAVKSGALTEDELVWLHGLRHRFATDLLKGLDKRGVKQPEEVGKHLTRHAHATSLEPYTTGRFFEDTGNG